MHELSIAEALRDLALRHLPEGAVVRSLRVRAGPLQAIDPEALGWAWQSVNADRLLAGARLDVTLLPWRLRCPDCAGEWTTDEVFSRCRCGGERAYPLGGDELVLDSIEVDDPNPADAPGGAPCK